MVLVNTHEAKTRLSKLLAMVEKNHEEVTICRNGKPVAKLVAITPERENRLKKYPDLQGAHYVGDPCAPLTEDEWPEEFR